MDRAKIDQARRDHDRLQNRRASIIVLTGLTVFVTGILVGGEIGKLLFGSVIVALLTFIRFMRFALPDLYERRGRHKIVEGSDWRIRQERKAP